MLIQSIMVLFYSRLQSLVEALSAERLQYYANVIETQAIRQQAMEQAFTQFHNGPLQSLAVLLQDVQTQKMPSPELLQRLAQLNVEIRDVGQSLIQSTQSEGESTLTPQLSQPQAPIVASMVRLGSGKHLDLGLPLHNLLYEVYATTLSRNLPHFQTIQIKVRNFAPLDLGTTSAANALTFDVKRDVCLWFEEALCNVGKHARGVTRLQVSGTCEEGRYRLRVQDNGAGLQASQAQAWLQGQGPIEGNRIVINEVVRPTGAMFGPDYDPSQVTREPWGSMELTLEASHKPGGPANLRISISGEGTSGQYW